jgi:hypothetical protein
MSTDPNALQNPLKQFRASTKRLKIHPLERAALIIVSINLVALPWAIGGMRLWSQIPSLILAAIGFFVSLQPRHYTEEHTGSNRFRLIMWPKLLRFPLFWLGLLLLGYITIQNLNPAWTWRSDGKVWWMLKIPYKEWLPGGVEAPLDRWGPWRIVMIYAATWLTVCTTWVAFTRRRTIQLLFLTLAVNGFVLAIFGLAQRLLSNGKMFWFWNAPSGTFFSSFVYKNHAGAYFNLALAVICGLGGWYYLRGMRRLDKSNPAGVFAFLATCVAVAVLVSYARGATFVMLAFLVITVAGFVIHQITVPNPNRKPVIAVVLIIIFGYFLKTGLEAVQSHLAWSRLTDTAAHLEASLEDRTMATKASIEMLKDNWKLGTGAGSFRFLFTPYQQRHPEIWAHPDGARMWWEHAHNDLVEFPIELGVPGVALIALAFGWLALQLVRYFFWQNPMSLCLALGLLLLVGYAWFDFPFQCPAILMLWWVMAVAAVMWAQLEELNLKG